MLISRLIAMTVATVLFVSTSVRAAEATLNVGDPAPKLEVSKWIKGEPVKEFAKGKIYVVQFWASWSEPCLPSLSQVSRLQEQYKDKDVVIIGQSIWEEKQDDVAGFVDKMGDKMNYRIALDELRGSDKGKMAESWMGAAGQNGIPTDFIVGKDGAIAWVGHPLELDKVLEQVVAGTFDAKKEAAVRKTLVELTEKLDEAMKDENWNKALEFINEIGATKAEAAELLVDVRFHVLLNKKDYAAAYRLGDKVVERIKDDAEALNELAWMIATEEGIEKRDLDLAEKLALRAVAVSKEEDAAILDTLARVYFDKGRLEKAIEVQTKAVAKASEDLKEMLEATLAKYKAKKQNADK